MLVPSMSVAAARFLRVRVPMCSWVLLRKARSGSQPLLQGKVKGEASWGLDRYSRLLCLYWAWSAGASLAGTFADLTTLTTLRMRCCCSCGRVLTELKVRGS